MKHSNQQLHSTRRQGAIQPFFSKSRVTVQQKADTPFFLPANPFQRKCDGYKKGKVIQPKSDGSAVASSALTDQIRSSTGNGKSLPSNTLSEMNASFGTDFSRVNVHTDEEAVQMNKTLNAQAFTYGKDIYFNEGKFAPETSVGKRLLAHELTHVIQQGDAPATYKDKEATIQKSPLATVAIGAVVVAAIVCAYEFFDYALSSFPDKSDKWKHCWVSCKIASWCGGSAFSLIIGAGKEGLDAVCDAMGKGCKAEFLDFVADIEGIGCANIPLLPCSTCCDNFN